MTLVRYHILTESSSVAFKRHEVIFFFLLYLQVWVLFLTAVIYQDTKNPKNTSTHSIEKKTLWPGIWPAEVSCH